MPYQRHTERGWFDLQCVVVNCPVNTRLFTVTHFRDEHDRDIPFDLQGPYISHWGLTGGDEKTFRRGSKYIQVVRNNQVVILPFRLTTARNEYSLGCPRLPNFGFGPNQVFWMCQGHTKYYRHQPKTLQDIVLEAAEDEALREKRFLI